MSKDININLTIKQGTSEEGIAALVATEVKKYTKPKFPKWEELGRINGHWTTPDSNIWYTSNNNTKHYSVRNIWPTRELAEAQLALSQLAHLRDYVNDGWKPNWNDTIYKYVIEVYGNEIGTDYYRRSQYFLVFVDAETRDGFLEAYRDLIEIAKPLL